MFRISKPLRWEILNKAKEVKAEDIVKILLKNRGIINSQEKKEFLNPTHPSKLSLKDLGIKKAEVEKALKRIQKAKKSGELTIVYGDYDADGISGCAILWECLYANGVNCTPYIPERFSEGYGLNVESVSKLKDEHPELGLIITVDHGVVANKKIEDIKALGVDIIVSDHHQPGKSLPKSYSVVHTTKIGGAALAWILSREIRKHFRGKEAYFGDGLELAALGTIADQLSLLGPNRSFAKYGIEALNKTSRVGLLALYDESGITPGAIGPYEIGFMIAPRINAMGRLVHAIDSLRLLCTKSVSRASELAKLLNKTNLERQKIVQEVVIHARASVGEKKGIIVLAHESYHEGVIGLAASSLVEEFYRPAIVISKKGEVAKASARSIHGFNIIEAIRKVEKLLLEGGGHPMAAGFSISSQKIEEFSQRINELSLPLLTGDILTRSLKIDAHLSFSAITNDLYKKLSSFNPTGIGNPTPTFITKEVLVNEARVVGRDGGHLKLKLEQEGVEFGAIAFGLGPLFPKLSPKELIDAVYTVNNSTWNGRETLELKIKDIKIAT